MTGVQTCALPISRFLTDDGHQVNWATYYCGYCYERSPWFWCEDCGEYREGSCYECGYECGDGIIHPYAYKPDPIFFPDMPPISLEGINCYRWPESGRLSPVSRQSLAYFGLELEVDSWDNDRLEGVKEFLAGTGGHFYAKHDGSLRSDEGVELVSHPLTLEAWRSFDGFKNSLEVLRQAGWRGWDVDGHDYGIHVHVSRIAFSGSAHLLKFIMLFRRLDFAMNFRRFAGRGPNDYLTYEIGRANV